MAEKTRPVFCYWALRGRGEPIRLLLEYTGADVEDRRLTFTPGVVLTKEWTDDIAPSLNTSFPNLPFYQDGDFVLTESYAILRHLARKHGMAPKSDPDQSYCEMLDDISFDLRTDLARVVYCPTNFENNKKKFIVKATKKLTQMNDFLKNKKFVTGNNIYYTDLLFFETLDILRMFDKELFKGMDNVNRVMDTISELDKVKIYRMSPRFKDYPIVMWYSHWGYDKEKDNSGNTDPLFPLNTWRYR